MKKLIFQIYTAKEELTTFVLRHRTKKGKLDHKDKNVKGIIKALCTHHDEKKGNYFPIINNDGNGNCKCELCKARFTTHIFNDEELSERLDPVIELFNQMKFMATATKADRATQFFLATMCAGLSITNKVYKRIRSVVLSTNNVKKKKKKNKDGYYTSNAGLGSWETKKKK